MPAQVLHAIVSLFAEAVRGWSRCNPDLLSAALAFNTRFSLAPLLALLILNTLATTLFSIQLQNLIPRLGETASLVPPWFSFLFWVYYSALIVMFGARFTHVYAERHGTPIAPSKNMMRK